MAGDTAEYFHRYPEAFRTVRRPYPDLLQPLNNGVCKGGGTKFTAEITPTSPAGGTWTAWLDPDVVGTGDVTTTLWVRGQNLNLGALPGGSKDVQVAEVRVFVVPAP